MGVSRSSNAADPSAPGAMQHLALNVESEADLLAMRGHIRSRGVNVLGLIDHGFCKSPEDGEWGSVIDPGDHP